ncbi:hypothetical protein O3G_MSEX003726 [Manduca sexta]|nr:hypothetical protein O3G_MSEX003726 [Manduca sexta]
MRNKWLRILKHRCSVLDWMESRICSKHFELKYFDAQKKLKDHAVPTLFSVTSNQKTLMRNEPGKSKVERLLNRMPQSDLTNNIKQSLSKMKEPVNLDNFVTDELKCKADAPNEAQLWLMIKKQDHLNTRLMDLVVQTKKHVEILQKSMEESRMVRKEQEQNIESLKYIVKCLQEKHATLEEQIEILTSIESR